MVRPSTSLPEIYTSVCLKSGCTRSSITISVNRNFLPTSTRCYTSRASCSTCRWCSNDRTVTPGHSPTRHSPSCAAPLFEKPVRFWLIPSRACSPANQKNGRGLPSANPHPFLADATRAACVLVLSICSLALKTWLMAFARATARAPINKSGEQDEFGIE